MFQSLNLRFPRGDDPQAVTENYRRVAEAMGGTLSDIVCIQDRDPYDECPAGG